MAEYAPLKIKSSVVGYGLAKKEQVQFMVARLLELAEVPQPADAADALAIAICHIHTAQTLAGRAPPKLVHRLIVWRGAMRAACFMFAAAVAVLVSAALGQSAPASIPVVLVDFSNPDNTPMHWTLILHRDGSGHFQSRSWASRRRTSSMKWTRPV